MTRIPRRTLAASLVVLLSIAAYAVTVVLVPPALAQTNDPPPRATPSLPTIAPTATQTAAPPPESERPDGAPDGAEATGRITGTVIDQTTGAPAPGVRVAVGDVVVISDGNGNYGREALAAGRYQVALLLTQSEGMPAQPPIDIDLAQGATIVQHLAFQTPTALEPTAQPTPTTEPTPTMTKPEMLPATGADWSGRLLLFGLVFVFLGTLFLALLPKLGGR